MAAIAVAFASDGRHLNRVQGVRLQSGDVALECVGHFESQRLVKQSVSLDDIDYRSKHGTVYGAIQYISEQLKSKKICF